MLLHLGMIFPYLQKILPKKNTLAYLAPATSVLEIKSNSDG